MQNTTGTDTDRANDADRERAPAIATENLGLTYADGTEAVRDVSLTIDRGECFGFLGPNGAGKTTTIKVLSTLLAPTSGTVRVNGYDVTDQRTAVRATIGYMAQETSVDEELTARENLQFACDAYGVPRGQRSDRIAELLELVDLADVADTPAGNFSGGMAKRLDAATALVHDPALVFLDEPTTGLDPKARNRLWEYFERINDQGTTVFLTTQYLEEADRLCDRLSVIRDGEIVADDSPAALKDRVGGSVLTVDLADGQAAAETAARIARERDCFEDDAAVTATDEGVRIRTRRADADGTDFMVALREAGLSVTGFDVEEPSLDDVFLSIVDDAGESDGELGKGRSTDEPEDAPEVTA